MDLSQDYVAIRWLQENVKGSPIIMEGNMVEYHWGTRNTIYTGLPNVIGWNWHQRQQRARAPEVTIPSRIADVNEFYLTSDIQKVKDIITKYSVRYIIVGQLEHALYPGLGAFKALKGWTQAGQYESEKDAVEKKAAEGFAPFASMTVPQLAADAKAMSTGLLSGTLPPVPDCSTIGGAAALDCGQESPR